MTRLRSGVGKERQTHNEESRTRMVAAVTGTLLIAASLVLALPPTASAQSQESPAERASSLELFFDVYGLTRASYVDTLSSTDLIEQALQGMLQSLDPNSVLLTPDELENLQIQLEGSFEGVGITLGQRDDWLTVISPIEGPRPTGRE